MILHTQTDNHVKSAFPRIAPFALFMLFIGSEEGLRLLAAKEIVQLPEQALLWLYPVKTLAVGLLLIAYRRSYVELSWRDLRHWRQTAVSVLIGMVTFVLWINMDWSWATFGQPAGYNPLQGTLGGTAYLLLAIRLMGASLLVPVMEELFWRSWLTRYLMTPDFSKTPVGRFTPLSFILSAILFGTEHNLVLAGIMAGLSYNFVLLRSKSIAQCILAHGVTNLALGVYVLLAGQWQFW